MVLRARRSLVSLESQRAEGGRRARFRNALSEVGGRCAGSSVEAISVGAYFRFESASGVSVRGGFAPPSSFRR